MKLIIKITVFFCLILASIHTNYSFATEDSLPTKFYLSWGETGKRKTIDNKGYAKPTLSVTFIDALGLTLNRQFDIFPYSPKYFNYEKDTVFDIPDQPIVRVYGNVFVDGVYVSPRAKKINTYLTKLGILVNPIIPKMSFGVDINGEQFTPTPEEARAILAKRGILINPMITDLNILPVTTPKVSLSNINLPMSVDWETFFAAIGTVSQLGISVCRQESVLDICQLKWQYKSPDILKLHSKIDQKRQLVIGEIALRDFQSKYIE